MKQEPNFALRELSFSNRANESAFARFDLSRVPSPCFVIDEAGLRRNLATLSAIERESGAKVLAALKAFSFGPLAALWKSHVSGTSASGLFEARMGRKEYGGIVSTYAPAYKDAEIDEIARISDHLIFNSKAEKERFLARPAADGRRPEIGLRINPGYSEGTEGMYDPCRPFSRLGVPLTSVDDELMQGVEGLHFHSLCEQGLGPLMRTWKHVQPLLSRWLPGMKWINLGGGHLITDDDYDRNGLVDFLSGLADSHGFQVFLEPGEAVALHCAILVGEVLDVFDNGLPIVVSDISAACHVPDVLEAGYRPDLLAESPEGQLYRFGGPSALAGDVLGDYRLASRPKRGQRFALLDQGPYTMVKMNTFNGIALPSIALWNSKTDEVRIVRTFEYEDFRSRLA